VHGCGVGLRGADSDDCGVTWAGYGRTVPVDVVCGVVDRRKGEGRWCEWTVGVLRGARTLSESVSVGELQCVHLPPSRITLRTSPPCITLDVLHVND
jgi:hypothetical protein